MKHTKLNQARKHIGKRIKVAGFIKKSRDQGKIQFIILEDRFAELQIIIKNKDNTDITKIPKQSVIEVEGQLIASDQAIGGIELVLESYKILSESDPKLPINIDEFGGETDLSKKLDYRWLDLRKKRNILIFEIWTFMETSMREYWNKNGFIQIYSPKFMGAPSESGAELFEVDYFGKKAFLAQSPQFYKQMAMASGFEKIFEIGPVFRANPSHTSRHDTEFTMIDMEISYINSHEDVMKMEEEWLQHIFKKMKKKYGTKIEEVFGVEIVVPKIPFPRVTMEEALEFLKKEKRYSNHTGDLDVQGEKLLFEIIKKKYKHDFVFITEYPWKVRPFYHMKTENGEKTKSYDLLWKGMEITTGAQREHRFDKLKTQAQEKNLNLEPIKDYLNFFKYGCPPHGGFGLSPTRMLMLLLNIKNVREVTFLPRDTERLNP